MTHFRPGIGQSHRIKCRPSRPSLPAEGHWYPPKTRLFIVKHGTPHTSTHEVPPLFLFVRKMNRTKPPWKEKVWLLCCPKGEEQDHGPVQTELNMHPCMANATASMPHWPLLVPHLNIQCTAQLLLPSQRFTEQEAATATPTTFGIAIATAAATAPAPAHRTTLVPCCPQD